MTETEIFNIIKESSLWGTLSNKERDEAVAYCLRTVGSDSEIIEEEPLQFKEIIKQELSNTLQGEE